MSQTSQQSSGGDDPKGQSVEGKSQQQFEEEYYIFKKEDFQEIDRLRRKIITTPLTFLVSTSLLAYAFKKMNLRRMLANPLRDDAEIVKNDKFWKIVTYHSITMGTAGFLTFSFFRSEAHKIVLYNKYQTQINSYMKWKTDIEVENYLLKETTADIMSDI